MQALVGKTGKEGLKRCCLQAEPSKINATAAHRAGTLLSELDLEEVRDVSAGAATFFVWVSLEFFLVIRRSQMLFYFRKLKDDCGEHYNVMYFTVIRLLIKCVLK